jgi:hypothetical protein
MVVFPGCTQHNQHQPVTLNVEVGVWGMVGNATISLWPRMFAIECADSALLAGTWFLTLRYGPRSLLKIWKHRRHAHQVMPAEALAWKWRLAVSLVGEIPMNVGSRKRGSKID